MSQDLVFNPVSAAAGADTAQAISSIDPHLSRTNYYDGRLLKASDLIRDQLYLDERLREVGRVLGHGIVRGLEVELSAEGLLSVSPGLAVARSGRVLELEERTLEISLFDNAAFAALNEGFRRLERGLYGVVVRYAEVGEGSAEIFPRDLAGERGFHFNAFAEGVEVTLTPLNTRSPNRMPTGVDRIASSIGPRAALVRELIGNAEQPVEIPEDGVALALLSIENGRPAWLDRGLLRRPHRAVTEPNRLQQDLHNHYEELLADVLQVRQQSVRQQEFPASHYFTLLPTHGSVPRVSVDPENGRQGFFPEGFEVSVAPVRRDDLDAIVAQSAALEPIDLARDKDVDIMLLVPMSNAQFATRARQLEHNGDGSDGHSGLAHLDTLALRLYDAPEVHQGTANAAVWRAIWAETNELMYVRRPTRVAETQVSAVVLATGYEIPPTEAPVAVDVEALEAERDRLAQALADSQRRIEALEAEQDNQSDERLAEALQQIQQLEAQIVELNRRLAEASGNDDVIRELRTDRDRLSAQLIEVQALSDSRNAQILTLTEQLTAATAGGDDARVRITELETQIVTLNDRLTDSAGDAATITQLQRERDDLTAQLAEVQLLADSRDTQVLNLTEQLTVATAGTEDAQQLVAQLEGQVVTLNGQLAQANEETREQLRINESLNTQITDLNTQVIDSRTLIASLQAGSGDDRITLVDIGNLRRTPVLDVQALAEARGFNDRATINSLANELDQNQAALSSVNQIAAIVDPRYEEALWSSLRTLARNDNLDEFLAYTTEALQRGLPLGTAVAARSNTFRLSTRQRNLWADVDLPV